MKIFAYMIEWFLVSVAIAGVIGLISLGLWIWNSDNGREK